MEREDDSLGRQEPVPGAQWPSELRPVVGDNIWFASPTNTGAEANVSAKILRVERLEDGLCFMAVFFDGGTVRTHAVFSQDWFKGAWRWREGREV